MCSSDLNNYCSNDGQTGDSSKYMLLCEVALGKIQDVSVSRIYGSTYDTVDPEFNSFKTCDSEYEPDPGTTIFWNGNLPAEVLALQHKERYFSIIGLPFYRASCSIGTEDKVLFRSEDE